MFKTLQNAFKIKDIRKKLLYTLFMLVVIRFGSQLPIPGVDPTFFKAFFENTADALGFFNAVTGGSFTNMSVFALSITPYITSSIIMQLLTIAIPKLEEMHKAVSYTHLDVYKRQTQDRPLSYPTRECPFRRRASY